MTAWATTVERLDDKRQFSALVGRVTPDYGHVTDVELMQIEHQPTQLRVGEYRYDLDQAADLASLILEALRQVS